MVRGRRHQLALPLALLAFAGLAGCGEDRESGVPAACKEGPESVRAALRAAPREVRLDGVRLSECLTEGADADDLQVVGAAYLEAAAGLARKAGQDPESRAAVELGYLVGAARRGGSGTQGVHTELLRRLDQELGTVDTRSPAFRRGERAGRSEG